MKKTLARAIGVTGIACLLVMMVSAQALSAAPADPERDMNLRFSKALGVEADKVVQHYYLVKNGGVVELTAKTPGDSATIAALQKYLNTQRDLFEKGKNETDAEVHGKVPDGMVGIKKFRNEITFFTAKTDNGALLRMFSVNPEARSAIQDYLRFQIIEHKTGDSPTIDQ